VNEDRAERVVKQYSDGQLTLGDAGHLADTDRWTMRDIFLDHSVESRIGPFNIPVSTGSNPASSNRR
jgi:hypothetical protein